ncbi:hypothetical protein [Helicobacter sp. MIT 05-5294]|uniref:hypothetical protein n=1 Tax=Helicobacter sp. MIT 05-5294 TaxID=1548150 RepID=UPI0010FF470B|nr:hypothetical protein [Helicobacter sp. MIT 05-5294]TLD88138.1 hypothetical protein LS69_002445 [Helicobacter sp. MIT 05-5294]
MPSRHCEGRERWRSHCERSVKYKSSIRHCNPRNDKKVKTNENEQTIRKDFPKTCFRENQGYLFLFVSFALL